MIYRIMSYSMDSGLASYLPMVFRDEDSAYALADHLNDRYADSLVSYAPVCVYRP